MKLEPAAYPSTGSFSRSCGIDLLKASIKILKLGTGTGCVVIVAHAQGHRSAKILHDVGFANSHILIPS